MYCRLLLGKVICDAYVYDSQLSGEICLLHLLSLGTILIFKFKYIFIL